MTAVATAQARTRPVPGSTLTGTGRLVRFILRRDRVRLSVWTLSVVFFYAYFAVALDAMGTTALAARAVVMETPAGIVMGGPGYGVEDYTVGVAIANEGITWMVLALAIMSVLHVVRHTRAEEESGRSELVRAAVVGRHAPSVAAIITLCLVNVVIAVVSALTLYGSSSGELGLADSFGLTVGAGLSAMVFGAFAVVFCQVTEHGRGATGMGLAVYFAALVLRSAGDIQERHGSLLSWFSPIGWAQQMRAFVDLRWWPAALSVGAIAALLLLGAFLASRRDFGGGMIATRRGRAEAPALLRSPLALAWRQQRSALGWCLLGVSLMWYATGTLLPEVMDMGLAGAAENPLFESVFGGASPEQFRNGFLEIMLLFAALVCAAYAIVMGGRARSEETAGRADVVLAGPVSRVRWIGAQLVVAGLGTVVLMAASTYGLWAGALSVGDDDLTAAQYTDVFWTYSVALLVYLAVTAVLYAWLPRATALGWLLLVYTFVIGMFGSLLEDLPAWMFRVSPFDWLPAPFAEQPDVAQVLGLGGIALVLFAWAFVGFRRRDLQST